MAHYRVTHARTHHLTLKDDVGRHHGLVIAFGRPDGLLNARMQVTGNARSSVAVVHTRAAGTQQAQQREPAPSYSAKIADGKPVATLTLEAAHVTSLSWRTIPFGRSTATGDAMSFPDVSRAAVIIGFTLTTKSEQPYNLAPSAMAEVRLSDMQRAESAGAGLKWFFFPRIRNVIAA